MNWIHKYDLFLFDFDGLLVDTEPLHHAAYAKMCSNHGYTLPWTLSDYLATAHRDAHALEKEIYSLFPELRLKEPPWNRLYEEKRQIFLDFLNDIPVQLMPGASDLLQALAEADIIRAVVTHSSSELVQKIRKHHPILKTIPHWITREDYMNPKPSSDCYKEAVKRLGKPTFQMIGFEDSLRGLKALLGIPATAAFINKEYASLPMELRKEKKICCYSSLASINDQHPPYSS